MRTSLEQTLINIAKRVISAMRNMYGRIWRMLKTPKRPDHDGPQWIHIGPGDKDDPRFTNVDARAMKHIHFVTNTPTLVDFDDNCADMIYACHVVEHFSHRHIPEVLENWRRVLNPGGTVRISVPDFNKIVDIYLEKERDVWSVHGLLMGSQSHDFNYHYTAFTKTTLKDFLEKAGFTNVRVWKPEDQTDWPRDHSWDNYISLNLEADA